MDGRSGDLQAVLEIVEFTVDLGFETMFEDAFEFRTRREAEVDQVASLDDWLRRRILDRERLRPIQKPAAGPVIAGRFGRPAGHVGAENAHQAVDADYLAGQPPDCGVTGV